MTTSIEFACSNCDEEMTLIVTQISSQTIDIDCNKCKKNHTVILPQSSREDSSHQQNVNNESNESNNKNIEMIEAKLIEWTESEPKDLFTGREDSVSVTQRVDATVEMAGTKSPYSFSWTSEHKNYEYVVKGQVNGKEKMKTVYGEASEKLVYTDRAVPRNSDKVWTYIDEDECKRRALRAGFDDPLVEDADVGPPHRTNLVIGEAPRPELVVDNEVDEEFLLKLARGLAVLQSDKY